MTYSKEWTFGAGGHLQRNTPYGQFRTTVSPERLRDPDWAYVVPPPGVFDFHGQFYRNEADAARAVDDWLMEKQVRDRPPYPPLVWSKIAPGVGYLKLPGQSGYTYVYRQDWEAPNE